MTSVTVDAGDLERLVRLAHQVDPFHQLMVDSDAEEDEPIGVDGVACMCGVRFGAVRSGGRESMSADGVHQQHVERHVRSALAGRIEIP